MLRDPGVTLAPRFQPRPAKLWSSAVPVPLASSQTRWRCTRCGNLTRFDVTRSSKVKEFWHLDLAGDPTVEETEVVSETVEQVRCRWCDAVDAFELVPRPDAGGPTADPS